MPSDYAMLKRPSVEDCRESIAAMPFLEEMVFAPLEVKEEAYGLPG